MEFKICEDSTFLPPTYDPSFHGSLDSNIWIKLMPYRKLGGTELTLSLLSYGGSSLAKLYGDEISSEATDTIHQSIKYGVNFIDTSPWYGESEDILGHALKKVPRNTFYIATKVGRNWTTGWENRFDFSRNAVLKNVENSLTRLGLDYLDIIQIHDLEFCLDPEMILKETLPALESVVKAGKARYIGITSYSLEAMKKVIETSQVKIDTILSYCRMNFHDTTLLNYMPFFEERNVGVINAAPMAMGLFTSRGPPEWHPASEDVKATTKLVASFVQDKGTTIDHTALGFGIRPENKNIATTLVSMPNKQILSQNLEAVTRELTQGDKTLYQEIIQMFKLNVKGSGGWEGEELEQYKKALAK